MRRVLVATRNRGKLREYAQLLSDPDVEWVTLDDVAILFDVPETGATFDENARLKAIAYTRRSGLLTLADDSGLVVDALDGAPGVYSARYAGEGATDEDRYRLLLRNMADVPDDRRTARFTCVVAVCTPAGDIYTAEGACEGVITHAPAGTNGFGYDPIFLVLGRGVTMAQLPPEEKNRISHRARALAAIRPTMMRLIGQQFGQ
jgi:XTP/dITP diphosphohydrolase